MSKLAAQDKFLDLSDYGRPFGKLLANSLKNTRFTPIHVTLLFGAAGLLAMYCIGSNHYNWAGFFIVLKYKYLQLNHFIFVSYISILQNLQYYSF